MYRSSCASSIPRASSVLVLLLAGMALVATGPQPARIESTPEQIATWARHWGVSLENANWWYVLIGENGMYTKAMWIPMYWNCEHGIMLALSNGASNRQYHADLDVNRDNRIITSHEFVWYDCYWYPKLVMFNIAGIGNAAFPGTLLPYNLGEILDRIAPPQLRDWRARYLNIAGGTYNDTFREVLLAFGVQYHLEMTFGLSQFAYLGIDAYVKVFHGSMPPPEYEAHFVLNDDRAPEYRHFHRPDQWWMCKVWRSIGQRESITESRLRVLRGVVGYNERSAM